MNYKGICRTAPATPGLIIIIFIWTYLYLWWYKYFYKFQHGKHNFKAATIMREAILISGILANSESWINITKKDLEKFQKQEDTLVQIEQIFLHLETQANVLCNLTWDCFLWSMSSFRRKYMFYIEHIAQKHRLYDSSRVWSFTKITFKMVTL